MDTCTCGATMTNVVLKWDLQKKQPLNWDTGQREKTSLPNIHDSWGGHVTLSVHLSVQLLLWASYLKIYSTNCHWIRRAHSCYPEDETCQFWWPCDLSSGATLRPNCTKPIISLFAFAPHALSRWDTSGRDVRLLTLALNRKTFERKNQPSAAFTTGYIM